MEHRGPTTDTSIEESKNARHCNRHRNRRAAVRNRKSCRDDDFESATETNTQPDRLTPALRQTLLDVEADVYPLDSNH